MEPIRTGARSAPNCERSTAVDKPITMVQPCLPWPGVRREGALGRANQDAGYRATALQPTPHATHEVLDIAAEPGRMGSMALGWKKLKIGGAHGTAEQAVSYLTDPQARGDYYTEGVGIMRWLATPRSRRLLGLRDQVSRLTLAMLLSGKHPVDGALIRHFGPDRTIVGGIDLTVNPAPKSVSILWALGNDE